MEATSQSYTYRPLDSIPGAIRLLKLKKGTGRRLEGELVHTTLEEQDSQYEAISYTWGDPKAQDVLWIGDRTVNITCNLSLVLRDLRQPDSDRVLWNDATCISQEDLDERGQQVQQMGRVYSAAKQVLFCIGRPTEFTDFLFDSINEFITERLTHGVHEQIDSISSPGNVVEPAMWQAYATALEEEHHMAKHRLRIAFDALLGGAWFQRVWIVQEVANARQSTVYCGRRGVPGVIFASVARLSGDPDAAQRHPAAIPVLDLMAKSSSLLTGPMPTRDLYTLIRTFSSAQASNVYDRIYALLSLATDGGHDTSLVSSYTATPVEVISGTIRHMIRSHEVDTAVAGLSSFIYWPFLRVQDFVADLSSHESRLLIWAVDHDCRSLARYLLEHGVDPAPVSDTNRLSGPICRAILSGHADMLKLLLDAAPHHQDRNSIEYYLCSAVSVGGLEECEVLLLHTFQAFAWTKENCASALDSAVRRGFDDIVELFTDLGYADSPQVNVQ